MYEYNEHDEEHVIAPDERIMDLVAYWQRQARADPSGPSCRATL